MICCDAEACMHMGSSTDKGTHGLSKVDLPDNPSFTSGEEIADTTKTLYIYQTQW